MSNRLFPPSLSLARAAPFVCNALLSVPLPCCPPTVYYFLQEALREGWVLSPLPGEEQVYKVGCLSSCGAGPDPTETGQCSLGNDGWLACTFPVGSICSLKAGSTANTTSKCCLLHAVDLVVRAGNRQHMPFLGPGKCAGRITGALS